MRIRMHADEVDVDGQLVRDLLAAQLPFLADRPLAKVEPWGTVHGAPAARNRALEVDDATIARSRGAAVNPACAALPYYLEIYPLIVERSWHKLAALGVRRRVTS